jgi:hypothetical protein
VGVKAMAAFGGSKKSSKSGEIARWRVAQIKNRFTSENARHFLSWQSVEIRSKNHRSAEFPSEKSIGGTSPKK